MPDPVFKVYFGEDQGERMKSLRPVLLLVFTGLLCWRSICCRRVSVRLSQAGIVSKRLNAESRKQRHAIAQGLQFSDIRYDTRCYFNVLSKADISPLNLPHGTDN